MLRWLVKVVLALGGMLAGALLSGMVAFFLTAVLDAVGWISLRDGRDFVDAVIDHDSFGTMAGLLGLLGGALGFMAGLKIPDIGWQYRVEPVRVVVAVVGGGMLGLAVCGFLVLRDAPRVAAASATLLGPLMGLAPLVRVLRAEVVVRRAAAR